MKKLFKTKPFLIAPLVFLIGLLIAWPSRSQGVPHFNHLTWNASTTPGVTTYKVYRSTVTGGPYTLLTTINSGTAVMYDDTDVTLGMRHCYVVTALAGSESPKGNEICVTDAGTNVNPPTGLAVVPN